MDGRRRRPGCGWLAAFLAAIAKLLGLTRTLDPKECAGGRLRVGHCHRMLDDYWRRPADNRRGHLVVLRGPGLAPDYRYRAVDGRRGIAAVEALGNPSGTVARVQIGRAHV